jgi:hypothetical protein
MVENFLVAHPFLSTRLYVTYVERTCTVTQRPPPTNVRYKYVRLDLTLGIGLDKSYKSSMGTRSSRLNCFLPPPFSPLPFSAGAAAVSMGCSSAILLFQTSRQQTNYDMKQKITTKLSTTGTMQIGGAERAAQEGGLRRCSPPMLDGRSDIYLTRTTKLSRV